MHFLRLKKEFDIVNHYLVLQNLEITYGFREIALDTTKIYLGNRQQYTKIGSKYFFDKNECSLQNIILKKALLFNTPVLIQLHLCQRRWPKSPHF